MLKSQAFKTGWSRNKDLEAVMEVVVKALDWIIFSRGSCIKWDVKRGKQQSENWRGVVRVRKRVSHIGKAITTGITGNKLLFPCNKYC